MQLEKQQLMKSLTQEIEENVTSLKEVWSSSLSLFFVAFLVIFLCWVGVFFFLGVGGMCISFDYLKIWQLVLVLYIF